MAEFDGGDLWVSSFFVQSLVFNIFCAAQLHRSRNALYTSRMYRQLLLVVFILTLVGCQTTSQDPKTALLYMDLGVNHLTKGVKEDALAAFLKAEKLDERNQEIQNYLGLTYLLFKKYSLASKHFQNALSLDNEYTEARNNLARALIEQGHEERARKELEIVFADLTYKNLAAANLNLGYSYFKQQRYREAIPYLEKSLRMHKNSCFAMSLYARSYSEIKDYKRSLPLFDLAMPLCQKINYDEAHYYGALAYFKSGQRTKGIALMNETILLYNQGDYEKKSREMLELMKLNKL